MSMLSRQSILATIAAIATLSSSTAAGWQDPARPETVVGETIAVRQGGTILGTAYQHDKTPLGHARLRLRNVTTGQIVTATQADADGRFHFDRIAAGSYVVELVDDTGAVRALGQMFSLGRSETVATFVRLAADAPWYSGFFGNTALTALSSAAALGVTAVGPGGQPASARQ